MYCKGTGGETPQRRTWLGNFHDFSLYKVVFLARFDRREIRLACGSRGSIVVKVGLADAQYLGPLPLNHNRGRLVQANPQKLRKALHDGGHVRLPLALREMLIDGGPRQEGEAPLVALGHHFRVAEHAPADQVLGLNRRAGTTAADHAAAGEHSVEKRFGLCAGVAIDKPPLPPAAEPDALGLAERFRKLRRLDFGPRPLAEH